MSLNFTKNVSAPLLIFLKKTSILLVFLVSPFSSFFLSKAFECAICAGRIIRASIKETLKVKITIVETSPKKLPILPSTKKKVENAIMVVRIAETIGGITSIVPSIAALILDLPKS